MIEKDNADQILSKGKKHNCFSYLGELSQHETRRLMNASDIFLNTSISEGMSGAILEAMAESLPVIATCNSGNAALVDNNENGFLVKLNDQEDLIEKLLRLISDKELRNNMGAKGRDKVEKYYTPEQEIVRLLKVYENVLIS